MFSHVSAHKQNNSIDIDVLLANCIIKARSEFEKVVKAEFAVDNWLFTNNYWQFFFKRAVDEQIALLRLSELV